MLINTEDPTIDEDDMDTSMSYYSNLLSDDPFNLDVESSLPPETDLLQHLSSKLEIPVGLDDDIPTDSEMYDDSSNMGSDNVLLEPLLNLLDSEGSNWGIDSFPNLTAYQNDPQCEVKMEIKQEELDASNGLPPSPSSLSSSSANGSSSLEAWGLGQYVEPKVVLETPPISPPVDADSSPPSSPQSSPLTPFNINNLNIINCVNNANSTNNNAQNTRQNMEPVRITPATVKVVPCARTANGITAQRIQPKPESPATPNPTITTASWSNSSNKCISVPVLKTGEKRKTIVLSAKDFAALAYGTRTNSGARLTAPVTTTNATPATQTTVRVQPVATTTLATQAIPAKVPLIPCQPLASSVPLTASIPIALASGTVMSTPATPTNTHVPPIKCSSVPVKREMEMKAIKRQQRMIKNRESACLSRKKKKEYVSSLENEISKLQQENVQLKLENEALRQQVKDMESISFLTNSPRSSILSRPKRAATVLCAVLLLFTLNFGAFNGLIGNRMDSLVGDVASTSTQVEHHGRTLLWAPNIDANDPTETSSDSVNSDSDEMFPPNLHPICPLNINRTESIRLDSELRRWIGVDVEAPKNISQPPPLEEDNLINWTNVTQVQGEPTRNSTVAQEFSAKTNRRRNQRKNKEPKYAGPSNEVDLYQKMRPPLYEYAAFLDSFPRRQDTFYVVSFSGDHILLPARALNSSVRPKMSLVLPAMPFNASAPPHKPMTMMQIDCEVINTQILQVKETDIPPHVRAKDPENSRSSEQNSKDAPKRKPAAKTTPTVRDAASQTYNNASLNATTKMGKVDVFANATSKIDNVDVYGNLTESAVVSASLNKVNDTNSNGSQSYRPYFVNSDYNPEKFPPSKLNAAFLRSSYASQSNEYPSVGKRVARFP